MEQNRPENKPKKWHRNKSLGICSAILVILAFFVVIIKAKVENATLSPAPAAVAKVKSPASTGQSSDLHKVTRVVDGDTIDVDIDGTIKRLRLIGADTPEVVDPRKTVQCFGREASAKTKELLSGQSVRLENDPTQGELDKYGRLLRYVFLPDGRSFNKLMIEQGYAHEYTYNTPYKYQTEYRAAQKSAEAAKRGLWADNVCVGANFVY